VVNWSRQRLRAYAANSKRPLWQTATKLQVPISGPILDPASGLAQRRKSEARAVAAKLIAPCPFTGLDGDCAVGACGML